jgi:hypothetical protein
VLGRVDLVRIEEQDRNDPPLRAPYRILPPLSVGCKSLKSKFQGSLSFNRNGMKFVRVITFSTHSQVERPPVRDRRFTHPTSSRLF